MGKPQSVGVLVTTLTITICFSKKVKFGPIMTMRLPKVTKTTHPTVPATAMTSTLHRYAVNLKSLVPSCYANLLMLHQACADGGSSGLGFTFNGQIIGADISTGADTQLWQYI
jgi:hypothetical protein